MIAFIPKSAWSLYVSFDSVFVYLGCLPDLYIVPEPDDESTENSNYFSIGRLCVFSHRAFGVGIRKPRFVSDQHYRYVKHNGTDYLLSEVSCLNIGRSVRCWFPSRLPIIQSELEKVIILEKVREEADNFNSKDSPSDDLSFSDFLISGTNRSWGKYMCMTPKDQEAILSCISDPSNYRKVDFHMMPVDSFYKSSIESNFADSQKESLWSARLNLSSYASLRIAYRS
jgi:hypothetical protein